MGVDVERVDSTPTISEEFWRRAQLTQSFTDEGERGILAEMFSSFQGEGPFIGRRQIFVRTAGCNLSCTYCDTARFGSFVKSCRIEDPPASGQFREIENPVNPEEAMEQVLKLRSPGVHSVSITGGEPLCQLRFVKALAMECAAQRLPVYLETNGFSSSRFARLVDWIDFAAIDLKLPSHKACNPEKWNDLIENELSCVEKASSAGVVTIAKAVILDSTPLSELEMLCPHLEGKDASLVLQPASGTHRPDPKKLMQLHQMASMCLEDVAVIPQAHKMMGVL